MALSIPKIKECIKRMSDDFGINEDQAKNIITYYTGAGDYPGAESVVNDYNVDKIKEAAAALGVALNKPVKASKKGGAVSNKGIPKSADNKPIKADAVKGSKITPKPITPGAVVCPETITAEIIPADAFSGDLPVIIDNAINDFCIVRNIEDLSKERQPQWRAACMYVGQNVFKRSKLLHDVEKEKTHGGIVYDAEKVGAVAEIWVYLCACFGKAPFIDDFCTFAGVSDSWIYERNEVTPKRMDLLQKLAHWQEIGLAGLIVDGRQNPTAALACLNHWHGWVDKKEICHISDRSRDNAPALPVFDSPIS